MSTSSSSRPDSSRPSADSHQSTGPSSRPPQSNYRILILGGGAAGLAAANELGRADFASECALIEPSAFSYDQPAWMHVGTEGAPKEGTRSPLKDHIPQDIPWIQDRVTGIDPERQIVTLGQGSTVGYEYLLIAFGTRPHWDRIRNLEENLGQYGICSVYGYELAEQTWHMIRTFEGGRALFTAPSTLFKGGSAPLHILNRAETVWRDTGVRDRTHLTFATAAPAERAGTEYADLIARADQSENIHVYPSYELLEVRPESGEALFSVTKGNSRTEDVLSYDLLHVVPPMRPPVLLEDSGLAHQRGRMKGYMDVDPESLHHPRFSSVYGIGDAIGIEGTKTGERARKQALQVTKELKRLLTNG